MLRLGSQPTNCGTGSDDRDHDRLACACRYPQAIEACNAPVHSDDAPKAPSHEPWQLWLNAQCAYHHGNLETTAKLLQQLLQRRQHDIAAFASFVEGMAAAPGQLQQGSECTNFLAAVVPLPTVEQVRGNMQSWEWVQLL
jgi:hypothetical protein